MEPSLSFPYLKPLNPSTVMRKATGPLAWLLCTVDFDERHQSQIAPGPAHQDGSQRPYFSLL